ncbi:MAG: endolytic transglycosylase MltG, partial [Brevundimonas sp.]|nr:endolytic transglycosylase MltG [Brevundimonas sp.]
PTEWNTYQIDGLPPTPIANPGGESIAAVLNPPVSDELFFVADGSGGHAFARTYDQHLANVARWREIERRKAGLPPADPAPPAAAAAPAAAPPGVTIPPGAQVIRVPQSPAQQAPPAQ